jgi:AcrR family transcriptional regulator
MAGERRRMPKQARSQQRVNQILDAAAAEFAAVGIEHATTNAIAARAGVPIGSLYQFFPHKEAIIEALVARYLAGLRAVFDSTLSADSLPVEVVIEQMLAGLARFESTHQGFGEVFGNSEAIHAEIVGQVEAMLARRYPQLAPAARHRSALVGVGIVKGLMPLAGALPVETALGEISTALLAYLRAVLAQTGSG